MECVIPLSVLAKLGKYGVKPYKPYNDAKKLLPEKYHLNIVEDAEVGKAIKVESEEDFLKFFTYFVEELLGKGEVVGQRVTYEGVPLEKYEKLYRELLECERDKSLYWERLQMAEKLARTLEKELEEETEKLRKEREALKKENQQLLEEIEELKKEQERQSLLEKIEKLSSLVERLPKEEKIKVLELLKELKGRLKEV